ncbi:hypothetical protein ECG_07992 [Echinococcus granulosus]|nr:hypothetical protein ECG_07992 [Echinococcus granulosus]
MFDVHSFSSLEDAFKWQVEVVECYRMTTNPLPRHTTLRAESGGERGLNPHPIRVFCLLKWWREHNQRQLKARIETTNLPSVGNGVNISMDNAVVRHAYTKSVKCPFVTPSATSRSPYASVWWFEYTHICSAL